MSGRPGELSVADPELRPLRSEESSEPRSKRSGLSVWNLSGSRSVYSRVKVVLVVVGLLLAACGGDGGSSATNSTADEPQSRAEEVAAELGCEQVTSAESAFENTRWPFDESLDCWLDGRPSVRVHTFAPDFASETVGRFEQRYGPDATNHCPDGELSPQFVIVGPDWAVVTATAALRDEVLDRLGGDYLEGDDTTPVSYPMVDPCPTLPATTAG